MSALADPRCLAIGDPQASFSQLLGILDGHGLLGPDQRLAAGVQLLSIGDHFDYPGEVADVGKNGLQIVEWLASHPPRQAMLLLGNHDLCRVMELSGETDQSFAEARALAASKSDDFRIRFGHLPSPGIVDRDFSSFSEAQRQQLQRLLLAGRMQLAASGRLPGGEEVLLTHAGLSRRELGILGLDEKPAQPGQAQRIARALNRRLSEAVERVRPAWSAGATAALDLAPLHVAGSADGEGGGLCYHRPANPDRPGSDKRWEFSATAPRRFDPRLLPVGLLQICGHTGHAKCKKELVPWVSEAALRQERGGLRTLRVVGDEVRYELGVLPPERADREATLYLIDGEMSHVPAADYPLFALGQLDAR